MPVTDEIRYRLLKFLSEHPDASQRDLAREIGISVGKVNYCLRALVDKGWIKVQNFRRSDRKSAYLYVVTPHGIQERVTAAAAFLERKRAEYDAADMEIRRVIADMEAFSAEAQKSR